MQTQAIDTAATAPVPVAARTSVDRPATPARSPAHWSCLPLQQLHNFELVEHQFAAQHVWFETAIALRPSNPLFLADSASLTLMPNACDRGLKVQLGNGITEVDFGYISSAALTIAGLDDRGHCVALVKTAEGASLLQPPGSETGRYAIQGITLNTSGTKVLRIESSAPFVLTRFWVNQGNA